MVGLEVDAYQELNHGAFVTSNTLRHLKLLNKQWISVSIETTITQCIGVNEKFEEAEEKKSWYPLQINIYKDDVTHFPKDNVLYVNIVDLFNIVKGCFVTFKRIQKQPLQVRFQSLPVLLTSCKDYKATNVKVSMVSCPHGNIDDVTVDASLQEFFKTDKFLREKELLAVRVPSHLKKSSLTPFLLWFSVDKMVAIDTSHVHVNKGRFVGKDTELILGGNVESHIPYCVCMVNNTPQLFSVFSSSLNHAFQEYSALLNNSLEMLQSGGVSTADTAILIEAPIGYGKGMVLRNFSFQHCMHFYEIDCLFVAMESFSGTEKRLEKIVANTKGPCVLYFKNVHLLCKDREGEKDERRLFSFFTKLIKEIECNQTVLLVASTTSFSRMSTRLFSFFVYRLSLDAPSQEDRVTILNVLTHQDKTELEEIAQKTSGFFLSDMIALVRKVCQVCNNNDMFLRGEISEDWKDVFGKSVEEIRALKSGTLSNVKVQKVTWQDVGGLEHVKKDIFDTIELPMKFPHLFEGNMQRSGLLFYGPPGCGKTLLAKAVATEFNLNFYSVKGPELINMYVGQSEENVRETFKTARRMAPCVVFFDEIDSLAPSRGRSGDSGGVMDRIVSQLLSELDGMQDNTNVFIIAATNRPDLLDPALLRPGRFDKLIYVGVPEKDEERLKLLKAVTLKMSLDPQISLDSLIQKLPRNLTGADFKALATEASMCCAKRIILAHENEKIALNIENAIVTVNDFEEAIMNCSPSVSMEELERYVSIRKDLIQQRK